MTAPTRTREVLHDRNFRRLFLGSSVSLVGSRVTLIALPLTALTLLDATAFQVGLLSALGTAAFLVIGLPAGAWIDRVPKRPVLIGADLARAAVVATIPLAWWLHLLTIQQLYAVALAHGVLTVFFDVAYQSFLPHVVGRDRLVHGNARLQMVESGTSIAAPGIGGGLIQLMTAPAAVALDAVSFLFSALAVRAIPGTVEAATTRTERRRLHKDILDGLRFVFADHRLRAIAACTSTFNLFYGAQSAMLIVLMAGDLRFPAAVIGLVSTIAAAGGLLGATTVGTLTQRLGAGRTIWLSAGLAGLTAFVVAAISGGWIFWVACAGQFASAAGMTIYNVTQVSLRQIICPDDLLGRMNATMRFLVWGTLPLGGLLGGTTATAIGARPTLIVAATGMSLAFLWVFLSPLRSYAPPTGSA